MSDLQKERKIPVFTVWKNNAILKNIFLINSPPNFDDKIQENHKVQEFEETLLVGRHPDCDIRLEHPSISRFHLRIHSLPSSNLLFLTDLSSVHGTWVAGKRIEPSIRTMVKEGDDLRIGGSSRVYKLHWIPISQAYDVSQPFVPPLDYPNLQEDEDEMNKDEEESVGLINEEVQNADNILDDTLKGLESLDLCEKDGMVAEKVVPLAHPLQPQKSGFVKGEDREVVGSDFEGLESLCLDDISLEQEQKEMLLPRKIRDEDSEYEDAHSVDSVLEGLVPLFMGENWEWVGQEDDYFPCPSEQDYPQSSKGEEDTGFVSSVLEGLNTFLLDENSDMLAQKITEENDLPCSSEVHQQSSKDEDSEIHSALLEGLDALLLDETSEMLPQKFSPSDPMMPEDIEFPTPESLAHMTAKGEPEFVSEIGKQSILQEEDVQDSGWSFWYGSLVAPSSPGSVWSFLNAEGHSLGLENESRHLKSEPVELCEPNTDEKASTKKQQEGELWSFWSGKMGVESVCSALSDVEAFSESENTSLTNGYVSSPLSCLKRQTVSPLITSKQNSAHSIRSKRGKLESICSSLSDAESFSESEARSCADGYQSQKSFSSVKGNFRSPFMTSDDQNPLDSIWSRRGKLASAPQVQTSKTVEKKLKKDHENVQHEPISRVLFNGATDQEDEQEEELFTPDKENLTPTTHKSMRKFALLKEMDKSSSAKSSLVKMTNSPSNHYEDIVSPWSDKENYSPRSQQKQRTARRASANQGKSIRLKERKVERMPFQSLLADSPQKIPTECSIPDADAISEISVDSAINASKGKCVRGGLPQWNMVVDTTTLLNKESRKTLQLLEGLKGTQLIIPRIVLTELASLRRQLSFFRRNPEVLSALEWIQNCMLKTPWWIHVQNTVEEGRPVATTPPASPHSQLSCGTSGSYAFSGLESRMELLSPTVEDDVLDYALIFRKTRNDGQLVLLSNDITLKIKSMAEGIICETPEEFRESLVNPFSERFRWADSSPRGQTWSCADDIVLKERFYPSSLKMTPKAMENVKGLKLILLHNSRYYERMTAVH